MEEISNIIDLQLGKIQLMSPEASNLFIYNYKVQLELINIIFDILKVMSLALAIGILLFIIYIKIMKKSEEKINYKKLLYIEFAFLISFIISILITTILNVAEGLIETQNNRYIISSCIKFGYNILYIIVLLINIVVLRKRK